MRVASPNGLNIKKHVHYVERKCNIISLINLIKYNLNNKFNNNNNNNNNPIILLEIIFHKF
jgi:hypothetical protein